MIGDRWGVTDSETLCSYPCDSLVASPTAEAWRGVSVAAPPEAVWPWVTQVRVAPYSYDWIDNLGRRSPRKLLGLPEPRPGDRFTTAGGLEFGRIISVDPGKQLTGTIMGAFLSYVLVPSEQDRTRLLFKAISQAPRWAAAPLALGDLVMARRQLLNFKRLAERTAAAALPSGHLDHLATGWSRRRPGWAAGCARRCGGPASEWR